MRGAILILQFATAFATVSTVVTRESEDIIHRVHCPCSFQPPFCSTRHKQTNIITRRRYQNDETQRDKFSNDLMTMSEQEYDPIKDWTPPGADIVQETIDKRITPLRRLTSPIFFSTDHQGRRVRGLGQLPSANEPPLVIVGNHQLGAIDIWLLVPQLIQERNIFVRGLGHPVIFQNDSTFVPGKQETFHLYRQFGALQATPQNFHRLLQTQQAVMHYPGGAREAYHGRNEAYRLFWPDKVDFVRMAAKFNATIVPLSAIGAADSVYILMDPEELRKLPFGLDTVVGKSFLTVREAARYNERNAQQPYIRPPPLIVPKLLPARHYFLFGKAFRTTNVNPQDRTKCRQLYQDIQSELNRGLDDLLRARRQDPFHNSLARFAYEQVTGKQAPTFSVHELNSHL